jgi:hypothetical protein
MYTKASKSKDCAGHTASRFVRFRDKQIPKTTNLRTILASPLSLSALLSDDKRSQWVGLGGAQIAVG